MNLKLQIAPKWLGWGPFKLYSVQGGEFRFRKPHVVNKGGQGFHETQVILMAVSAVIHDNRW